MTTENKLAEVEQLVKKWRSNEDNAYRQIVYETCAADLEALFPVISRLLDAARRQAFAEAPDCADVQEVVVKKLGAVSKDALDAAHADALKAAAEHQQHHIFSVHSGAVVQSWCSCGEQFPTQGSCEAWKQHILALTPERARMERELEVARAKHSLNKCWREVADEQGRSLSILEKELLRSTESDVADLEAKLAALVRE